MAKAFGSTRIVQPSAEDRQDVDLLAYPVVHKILHPLHRSGDHALVRAESDHFRRPHQPPGTAGTDYEVPVDRSGRFKLVHASMTGLMKNSVVQIMFHW